MPLFPTFIQRKHPSVWSKEWWSNLFGGGIETEAGTMVSENTAMRISTVFDCVTLISETIASLPLKLYRKKRGGGKEVATDHRLYHLLHDQPNPEMTSFSRREAGTGNLLLWGNKYDFIERSIKDPVKYIRPVESSRCRAERKAGRIVYFIRGKNGAEKEYQAEDILHVPGFGYNGLFGKGVIAYQREKLGTTIALEEFEARFFSNGTHPTGVLSTEKDLGDDNQRKAFAKLFREQYEGLGKSHKVMVLDKALKFDRMTMPLDQAQFLELTKAKAVDICGMFKVPPHMVGILDRATFSNIEHQAIQFVVNCIRPWLVRDEQAMNVKLLTEKERRAGYYVEHNVDGLLRGDIKTRYEAYQIAKNNGWMNGDEIRGKENMNPMPNGLGKIYTIPLNMLTLGGDDAFQDPANSGGGDGNLDRRFLPYAPAVPRLADRANRSVLHRDRIARQFYPLFRKEAEAIVNREGVAVKRQVKKIQGERSDTGFGDWLKSFYQELPDYVRKKIGPVFRSFAAAIKDASAEEIGIDPAEIDIETFVRDIIDRYVERHIDSSVGQLSSLNEKENLDALEARVDEWSETRPDKIAANETVRVSSAVFQMVAFTAGLGTFWRIRGAETCPYCREFNGQKIRAGESFVADGVELNPDGGDGPMKIRGTKAHPPLHQGCDCYLTAG